MKKSYITLLISIGLAIGAKAQDNSASAKIKEWTTANKDNITFVSQTEYNSMSPAVKAIFNATENTLVYKNTITIGDIREFHAKNKNTEYVRFDIAEIENEEVLEISKNDETKEISSNEGKAELTLHERNLEIAYKKRFLGAEKLNK